MSAISEMLTARMLACMVVSMLALAAVAIGGPSPEYLALLEAAKAEGKVAIGGFAFDPEEVETLAKGFKKRFGFPVKIASDPTHIRDIPPKVIAGGFDVVELNVGGGYQVLESERGLVNVDWSLFYQEFPKLEEIHQKRPAEDVPCLLYLNAIFGIIYNTKLVKEAELPETIEDFADLKWRGRFVLWDNGNPFDFIAVKYGKERALELARKLKSNKPILSRSAAILTLIASGEAVAGATAITTALGEINKGAPLGVKPYRDIIPALNNQLCVVAKSPHPNMAKLFAAWHAAEGIHLIADSAGHYRALPGDENALTRSLMKWGKTVDDFTVIPDRAGWKYREEVTKEVAAILTGAK
jgi:ABC-type Fe3+ transport system substrate-binding protein